MSRPQIGDRVKVSVEPLEGEVVWVGRQGFDVQGADGRCQYFSYTESGLTVKKQVEPPVEYFKPGDRIGRRDQGYEVTLGEKGYLQHFSDGFTVYYKYGTGDVALTDADPRTLKGAFHSDYYELAYRAPEIEDHRW